VLIQDFLLVHRAVILLIGFKEFRNDRFAKRHGDRAMINQHLGDHVTESHKSPLFWRFQIGGWIFFTLLLGIVGWILIKSEDIPPSSGVLLFELVLLSSIYGLLITSFLRPTFIWIHSRRWSPLIMVPVVICISFPITVIGFLIIRIPFLRDHFSPLFSIHLVGANFATLGFYVELFIFSLWIVMYFSSSLFFDSLELSRRQQKSELSLLRYQMQPHFLFNALTAVMGVSGDRAKVEALTQSLADYLRFSLSKSGDDASPLGDELDALENYLHVEKIRFAENLNYRIDADEEMRAISVLRHLVQPLLENAIKYGQQTSPMPLSILIQVRRAGGKLQLLVENTGSWVEPSASSRDQGMGIGISNLRRRLQLVYSDRASLTYEHSPQRVRAMVTLPIIKP
jgi:anti-sigma regulatory factor (Ser/Thr protein kinase)